MKKLLSLIAVALFGFSVSFAQTATAVKRTTVATNKQIATTKKATTDAKTTVKKDVKKVQTSAKKSSVKLKADGTPDMRYAENKTTKTTVVKGPVKKDGTADMRYKVNQKK